MKYWPLFSACTLHCKKCTSAGSDNCDAGECDSGYALDSTNQCRGKYDCFLLYKQMNVSSHAIRNILALSDIVEGNEDCFLLLSKYWQIFTTDY